MTDTHDFRLEIKAVDDAGTFSGLASTFGPPADSLGDVIAADAFAKTLAKHKASGTVPIMLWGHDTSKPIGKWTEIKELGRGLAVKGRLTLGVQKAREAHALLLDGAITGLSIGYNTRESHAEKDGTRVLTEVDLLEISLVTLPANQSARVTVVKGDNIKSERELERLLRDGGMPSGFAKLVVHHGFKGAMTIVNRRDVGGGGEDLAKALRRAAGVLTTKPGDSDEQPRSERGG